MVPPRSDGRLDPQREKAGRSLFPSAAPLRCFHFDFGCVRCLRARRRDCNQNVKMECATFFYFKFFQLHLNNPIKVDSDWPVDLVSAKSGPLILKFNFEIYSNDWVTGEATASAESLNPPIRPDFRRLEASHLIPIFTQLKHYIHFFLNFDYNFWIIYIKLSRVQYNFMQIRRLNYSNHIELHIIL